MKQTWIESTDIPSSCIRSLWPQMVTGVTRHLALDTKCNLTNFLCIYIHYRCRNCKSTLARTINFVWLSVASQAQEYRQRCILCFLINHSHCMLSTATQRILVSFIHPGIVVCHRYLFFLVMWSSYRWMFHERVQNTNTNIFLAIANFTKHKYNVCIQKQGTCAVHKICKSTPLLCCICNWSKKNNITLILYCTVYCIVHTLCVEHEKCHSELQRITCKFNFVTQSVNLIWMATMIGSQSRE